MLDIKTDYVDGEPLLFSWYLTYFQAAFLYPISKELSGNFSCFQFLTRTGDLANVNMSKVLNIFYNSDHVFVGHILCILQFLLVSY